jgi:hypothetical protein
MVRNQKQVCLIKIEHVQLRKRGWRIDIDRREASFNNCPGDMGETWGQTGRFLVFADSDFLP